MSRHGSSSFSAAGPRGTTNGSPWLSKIRSTMRRNVTSNKRGFRFTQHCPGGSYCSQPGSRQLQSDCVVVSRRIHAKRAGPRYMQLALNLRSKGQTPRSARTQLAFALHVPSVSATSILPTHPGWLPAANLAHSHRHTPDARGMKHPVRPRRHLRIGVLTHMNEVAVSGADFSPRAQRTNCHKVGGDAGSGVSSWWLGLGGYHSQLWSSRSDIRPGWFQMPFGLPPLWANVK